MSGIDGLRCKGGSYRLRGDRPQEATRPRRCRSDGGRRAYGSSRQRSWSPQSYGISRRRRPASARAENGYETDTNVSRVDPAQADASSRNHCKMRAQRVCEQARSWFGPSNAGHARSRRDPQGPQGSSTARPGSSKPSRRRGYEAVLALPPNAAVNAAARSVAGRGVQVPACGRQPAPRRVASSPRSSRVGRLGRLMSRTW